jgi:hypothetical protein
MEKKRSERMLADVIIGLSDIARVDYTGFLTRKFLKNNEISLTGDWTFLILITIE